ncbi:MAG: FISUMP domain-containing protein [Bacteroidales bacterium]|jgi:uncharacterized protein (TIGR02145 family)
MKTLTKKSLFLFLSLLLCTCVPLGRPDPGLTGGSITITGQTEAPGTKTSLSGEETHWEAEEDKIGIFSPEAKSTSDGTPEANPVKNLALTARTEAKSSDFYGSLYWGSEDDHHFYAYYPYGSEYSEEEEDTAVVPISLPSAQTQSATEPTDHIGILDFMVATPIAVTPPEAVNFTFNHVFTMIEFKITGSGTLKGVSFTGAQPLAFNSGTIDLTQTFPGENNPYAITKSYYSNNVIVMLTNSVTLTAEPVSIYMMILPGAQTNMDIALYDGSSWKYRTKAAPSGVLSRGKKYELSLNAGDGGWTEGTGTNASYFVDSRDENEYDLVVIGGQVWMKENLAYLPSEVGVVGPETGSTSAAYCYVYGYDGTSVAAAKATSNYTTYGVLYNWTAAMNGAESSTTNPSGVQGVCPSGWHLPSDAEWKQLEMALGMSSEEANNTGDRGTTEGGKMKETGTEHWESTTGTVTNESGFTALPGGFRDGDGGDWPADVEEVRHQSYWWSSTLYDSNACYRGLFYTHTYVHRNNGTKAYGFYVRCLRD